MLEGKFRLHPCCHFDCNPDGPVKGKAKKEDLRTAVPDGRFRRGCQRRCSVADVASGCDGDLLGQCVGCAFLRLLPPGFSLEPVKKQIDKMCFEIDK